MAGSNYGCFDYRCIHPARPAEPGYPIENMSESTLIHPTSLVAAQHAAWLRLAVAMTISLSIHAGALFTHPGDAHWSRVQNAAEPRAQATGSAAPITVRLASYQLLPAVAMTTPVEPKSPLSRPVMPSAPAIVATELGSGGFTLDPAERHANPALPPGLPLPNYYDANEVSLRPRVLDEPELETTELDNLGGAGKLHLILFINEVGRIDRVEIGDAAVNPGLAEALARQFGKIAFEPARIDDFPVKSRLRIEILVRPLLRR